MKRPGQTRALCLCLLACTMARAAFATDAPAAERDPTRWPVAMRAAAEAAAQPASGAEAAQSSQRQLLFVDGRRYLLQGARRLGIGDRLGEAVLVRIEPDAIWLRQDGNTRREPLYPRVELRHSEPAAASAPARAAHRKTKTRPKPAAPAAAPASEVQP